jgi:protein TonB
MERRASTDPATNEPELPRLPPVIVDRIPVDDVLTRTRLPGEFVTSLSNTGLMTRDTLAAVGNVDDVMTAMTVDQQVEMIPGQRPPRYPSMLERAGVVGDVLAQFVVDTTGRVERGSLHIQQATHTQFARSVEERLLGLRFVPARARGRAVRQLVEQRFHFEIVRR